jgi:hypothetical protein
VSDVQSVNRFQVHAAQAADGWVVRIVDPDGSAVWTRPCADEREARTFASTVQQHIYWLSEPKFREYYRLAGSDGASSG